MTGRTSDRPTAARPPRGLRRRIAQAWACLAWEAVWPAVWPVLGVAGLFCGIALLDVFAWLPAWLHALLLALFAAAFGYAAWTAARRLILPTHGDAIRRIESASRLDHRPLAALEDRLPDGVTNPATRELWEAHQRRMRALVDGLRVGPPSPGLPARDPWALRIAVVVLVFVGAVVAGPESRERLGAAFAPQFAAQSPALAARLEIWITPPEYTRLPPLFPIQISRDHARAAAQPAGARTGAAASGAAKPSEDSPAAASAAPSEPVIPVPAGSVLTAIVSGGSGAAVLTVGGTPTPFKALDKANSRLEMPLAADGRIEVTQGGASLGSWRIALRADAPPQIAFEGAPAATARGSMRMAYKASDDYGIAEIRGEMRRTYERGQVIGKEVSAFELPAASVNARQIRETVFQEIAPHPWAGLPVVIRLAAKDAAGQESFSDEIKLVLPEREFRHPVARQIIAERRRLTTEPERRGEIIDAINGIASAPEAFKNDTVVFLGLVLARSRLHYEKDEAAIPPVRDLMWDTALRVEDGQLSLAERELMRAQQALMDALARDAKDEELERLMRELQAALNRYMAELAKKLEDAPQADPSMQLDPTQRIMESADFQRMLDQIRQMMRSGARDAARQMLSQLRNMLEMLRNARVMRGNPQAQRGNQAMRQLQDLIRRQNELMDRTFRMQQGAGPNGQQQMQQGADQQRALREALRRLQQMMQGMMPGNSPGMQSLGQAGREMDNATQSLGQGRPGDAVGSQGQALEALQRAGRGMMQQMMNRFARDSGMGIGRQFNPMRSMRDPLGREWQGEDGTDTRSIKIPDEGAVERAQRILEELRKRAGQRHRPQIELDYINRLLQRF